MSHEEISVPDDEFQRAAESFGRDWALIQRHEPANPEWCDAVAKVLSRTDRGG